ncbi:MAG: YIP1 family protein [Methanomicrobiales archaeon]
MNHSIIDLHIRTGEFFQDVIKENESLKFPAPIILSGGIVGAMYGYLIGGLTGQLLNGIMSGMVTITPLSTVLGALIVTFIFWVIWTGVMYAF